LMAITMMVSGRRKKKSANYAVEYYSSKKELTFN
jgi:hypothetical protein